MAEALTPASDWYRRRRRPLRVLSSEGRALRGLGGRRAHDEDVARPLAARRVRRGSTAGPRCVVSRAARSGRRQAALRSGDLEATRADAQPSAGPFLVARCGPRARHGARGTRGPARVFARGLRAGALGARGHDPRGRRLGHGQVRRRRELSRRARRPGRGARLARTRLRARIGSLQGGRQRDRRPQPSPDPPRGAG